MSACWYVFFKKLVRYIPEYRSDFEYKQIIANICIKIDSKYNRTLWLPSFHQPTSFSNAPSRFTFICQPVFTHLARSPISNPASDPNLLWPHSLSRQVPGSCWGGVCAEQPAGPAGDFNSDVLSPVWFFLFVCFWINQSSGMNLSMFLGQKKSYDKNFHFILHVDTFKKENMSLLLNTACFCREHRCRGLKKSSFWLFGSLLWHTEHSVSKWESYRPMES